MVCMYSKLAQFSCLSEVYEFSLFTSIAFLEPSRETVPLQRPSFSPTRHKPLHVFIIIHFTLRLQERGMTRLAWVNWAGSWWIWQYPSTQFPLIFSLRRAGLTKERRENCDLTTDKLDPLLQRRRPRWVPRCELGRKMERRGSAFRMTNDLTNFLTQKENEGENYTLRRFGGLWRGKVKGLRW